MTKPFQHAVGAATSSSWGIYHLTNDAGLAICGKPQDLRHRDVGLSVDPQTYEPCPDCLVAAVTAGD